MEYKITLPLAHDIETKTILKQCISANKKLAELKGIANTIPNEEILINTLILQEAKHSSEIENIITTQDDIFKAELFNDYKINVATKEVQNYIHALHNGFKSIRKNKILTINNILAIQENLEQNKAGFRKLLGTELKNDKTGEVIYTPPPPQEIIILMHNLEIFINNDEISDLDPLIKMAIIHHQFESIHPFYDGNGRTGRIINILYLICKDLLNTPILYLSRYIIENKSEYYRLLQYVRDNNKWEEWILFILKGIEQTAAQTIELVKKIEALMYKFKHKIRQELPKIYSQDLLNNIFKHPYTKIEFLEQELGIQRKTAAKYLDALVGQELMTKEKIGKYNYYINTKLVNIFIDIKSNKI